jgi:hypothetical protein
MCIDFEVPYIKIDDFQQILINKYNGNDLLENVSILNTLEIEEINEI